MKLQFDKALSFGKVAESIVARMLMDDSWTVMPVYETDGEYKGPQVFAAGRSLVAPDMFVWKGKHARWVEAKRKSSFTWHRLTGQWVTGIDLRHYEDYLAVEAGSPWRVCLVFLQEDGEAVDSPSPSPTGLYWQWLSALAHNEHHRWDGGGSAGPMVYWAEGSLVKARTLEQVRELGKPVVV